MNKENSEFDFQAALKAIQSGKPLLGKEGILTPLIKDLTEAALEGELDSHLGQEVSANRRNGKSKKTIKSLNGNFELSTPRDRDGTFSPQLVKKHQTTLTDEIEQKIIALYGLGMSYNDISSHIQEMYGLEVSTGTLSAVTDKIINTVKEWQGRPLETIYPIVWLDAIHYKIRENGKVIGKQAGVEIVSPTMGEKKETIICLSEFETSASGKILACPQGLAPETVKKKKPGTRRHLILFIAAVARTRPTARSRRGRNIIIFAIRKKKCGSQSEGPMSKRTTLKTANSGGPESKLPCRNMTGEPGSSNFE